MMIKKAGPKKQIEWWTATSQSSKIVKRMLMKDTDGDGVPDVYDCEPQNPKKHYSVSWQYSMPAKRRDDR